MKKLKRDRRHKARPGRHGFRGKPGRVGVDAPPRAVTEKPVAIVAAPVQRTVIEPPRRWQWINLDELWRYRELLFFLAWRDVKVRYKQTVLGAAWAVLQPAMMMVVFTIFFGRLAKMDSGGVPYVWKDSTVLTPQAWPLRRSSSVHTTQGSSGA